MKTPIRRPSSPARPYRPGRPDYANLAVAALVLGIVTLGAWLIPAVGIFMALVGLVLAYLSQNSPRQQLARIGLILNGLGLLMALANALLGSYLGLTGFF